VNGLVDKQKREKKRERKRLKNGLKRVGKVFEEMRRNTIDKEYALHQSKGERKEEGGRRAKG
jgi:hypothetical protein